ncbi:MAG: hypothetical protein U5K56_05040 [Halioglobus sp.]|nr:hypothetical protein [Halioglobus sp.]
MAEPGILDDDFAVAAFLAEDGVEVVCNLFAQRGAREQFDQVGRLKVRISLSLLPADRIDVPGLSGLEIALCTDGQWWIFRQLEALVAGVECSRFPVVEFEIVAREEFAELV